jgi:hypothetical protein
MANLGLPFQGTLIYWDEDSYGSGESVTTLPISCKIQDARVGINDKHKKLFGIDSACACHLLEQATDVVFHLEYIPQCDDTLLEKVIDRQSTGTLLSLAFELGTNVDLAVATDKTFFYMLGCKPKTIRVSSSFNTEYVVAIDFSVKSATTSTASLVRGGYSYPTALAGDYLAFHVAGSIVKTGAMAEKALAYIVDAIDITFEHNLIDKWDHNSLVKKYCIEGAREIDGTVDITLDEGGGYHWYEIMNQSSFLITVHMGAATCPKLLLPTCQWKSGEFDVNISGEPMMDSAPFTSHASSRASCINVVR